MRAEERLLSYAERISSLPPETAFYDEDFLEILGAIQFPHPYHEGGKKLSDETVSMLMGVVARICCALPPQVNTYVYNETRLSVIDAFVNAYMNAENLGLFAGIFMRFYPESEDGAELCLLRKMRDFRSPSLAGSITKMILQSKRFTDAELSLFMVAVENLGRSDARMENIDRLIEFAKRCINNEGVPEIDRIPIRKELADLLQEKARYEARAELIGRMAQGWMAKVYCLEDARVMARLQKERNTMLPRNDWAAKKLRICAGRC